MVVTERRQHCMRREDLSLGVESVGEVGVSVNKRVLGCSGRGAPAST